LAIEAKGSKHGPGVPQTRQICKHGSGGARANAAVSPVARRYCRVAAAPSATLVPPDKQTPLPDRAV